MVQMWEINFFPKDEMNFRTTNHNRQTREKAQNQKIRKITFWSLKNQWQRWLHITQGLRTFTEMAIRSWCSLLGLDIFKQQYTLSRGYFQKNKLDLLRK